MSRINRARKKAWWRLVPNALVFLGFLVLFAACDTGEGMDLRLFCQRYNQTAETQARLEPRRFAARQGAPGEGRKYEAYITETMLLTFDTLPDGLAHTISLTALPETTALEFRNTAVDIIKTFCAMENDTAERRLNSVQAGEAEILGYVSHEENGFRLTYAANASGRYLRVSQLRFLPEETELPTLKDFILDD